MRSRQPVSATAIAAVMLLALGLPAASAGAGSDLAPGASSDSAGQSVELDAALQADGRFVGREGLSGTIDGSAWSLVSNLAAGEPPRFAAAADAAAPPTVTWSALGSNGAGDGAFNSNVYAAAVQ